MNKIIIKKDTLQALNTSKNRDVFMHNSSLLFVSGFSSLMSGILWLIIILKFQYASFLNFEFSEMQLIVYSIIVILIGAINIFFSTIILFQKNIYMKHIKLGFWIYRSLFLSLFLVTILMSVYLASKISLNSIDYIAMIILIFSVTISLLNIYFLFVLYKVKDIEKNSKEMIKEIKSKKIGNSFLERKSNFENSIQLFESMKKNGNYSTVKLFKNFIKEYISLKTINKSIFIYILGLISFILPIILILTINAKHEITVSTSISVFNIWIFISCLLQRMIFKDIYIKIITSNAFIHIYFVEYLNSFLLHNNVNYAFEIKKEAEYKENSILLISKYGEFKILKNDIYFKGNIKDKIMISKDKSYIKMDNKYLSSIIQNCWDEVLVTNWEKINLVNSESEFIKCFYYKKPKIKLNQLLSAILLIAIINSI